MSAPISPSATLLTDSLTMTRRGFAHWSRRPGSVAVEMIFPVMMLVMFAYFIGGGMAVEGDGDYTEFLVPGMLALTMAFGLEATMVALTQDINRGGVMPKREGSIDGGTNTAITCGNGARTIASLLNNC